jgi:XTP/dITP diphosphohydrolase
MADNQKHLLVVGTGNRKKVVEILGLLSPLGFSIKTLSDFPKQHEVIEDGTSFAENAAKKASEQAQFLGQWTMGEDSGIVVDALDGRPGIYSARYAGEPSNDEANNDLLLKELENVPFEKRTAHYVSSIAISDPSGTIQLTSEDTCSGKIRFERDGTGGFGYDPLFEIPEYHKTFGVLPPIIKEVLSHRGRALRKLIPGLIDLQHSGKWAPEASD